MAQHSLSDMKCPPWVNLFKGKKTWVTYLEILSKKWIKYSIRGKCIYWSRVTEFGKIWYNSVLWEIIWPSEGTVTKASTVLHADKRVCWVVVRTHLHPVLLHRGLWKLAVCHHGRLLGSHAEQTPLQAQPLCSCFHTCSGRDGSSTGRGTHRDTLVVTRERHVSTVSASSLLHA